MKDTITLLNEILNHTNWTQSELAIRLELSQVAINNLLNGKSKARKSTIDKIKDLHLEIVGRSSITDDELVKIKKEALTNTMDIKELIHNEQLLDLMTLYLTYHTNTIEGSTMTLSDVKEVLDDDNKVLTNKTAKEQTEARNHRTALFYLLDELNDQGNNFKWTKELLLQTHLRLMNTLISNAGSFRNHGVRILGSHTTLANYLKVPKLIDELIIDLNTKQQDPIKHLANIHARFERIHPFTDGNGRTGRLIMFIQALQYRLTPPLIIKERKKAYYRYLEKVGLDDDYTLLELMLAESMIITDKLTKGKKI